MKMYSCISEMYPQVPPPLLVSPPWWTTVYSRVTEASANRPVYGWFAGPGLSLSYGLGLTMNEDRLSPFFVIIIIIIIKFFNVA